MVETIAIAIAVEIALTVITAAATIPGIKKELQLLNANFVAANKTQQELVKQVIRNEERLDNHIADTHIHNN